MTSGITLSAGVRANLLSLQNTAQLMQTTQNRLATGKKVNSALDNPLNFFTSSSLGARAGDLNGLLDSMSNGIQTIQTANNGLTAVTSLVQQLQATVSQARSDSSAGTVGATPTTDTAAANTSTQTNNTLSFDVGGGVNVSISTFTHTNAVVSTLSSTGFVGTADLNAAVNTIDDGSGNPAVALTFVAADDTIAEKVLAINTSLAAGGSTVTASIVGGSEIRLTNSTGLTITANLDVATAADLGIANGAVSTDGSAETNVALTNAELATAINANSQLQGKVSATEAAGVLTLNNLSTTNALTVTGFDSTNVTGDATDSTVIGVATGGTISAVRQSLLTQFNALLSQIDTTASDSGYNGINLLNGDTLKLNFNENGTSSVNIQTKDSTGASIAINATNLGIAAGTATQFGDNAQLDTLSTGLTDALTTLRTQASALGSSLSVVQTRQDFTKAMINSLQTGADNLVLADSNQEGANLLALQTRQSLSTTALSLSAQADQAVLSLFQ
jgi:flagellin